MKLEGIGARLSLPPDFERLTCWWTAAGVPSGRWGVTRSPSRRPHRGCSSPATRVTDPRSAWRERSERERWPRRWCTAAWPSSTGSAS